MLKVVKDLPKVNHCRVLLVLVEENGRMVRKLTGLCNMAIGAAYHECRHSRVNPSTNGGCKNLSIVNKAGKIITQCQSSKALKDAMDGEIEFLIAARDELVADMEANKS